ncbi:MAG TPA: nodulation protein NfeD, partial [Bryobacteraceae bacterium]|nr:nodulation protein NfeD [Bryobacteraceae bacterium]
VDNVISPVTAEIVANAVDQAHARSSAVLLIRLDTPGGLMEASREVVEKLIASPVPVVTWVAPSGARAASAGFFVLLSGDVAAMAPGTHTGAASPIVLGKELDPVLRRKVESDAGAWLRSIASRRGRNVSLAEKAVSEAKSFTEQEALDSNLINLIAKDEAELLRRLDGMEITRFDGRKQRLAIGDAKVASYELSVRQKILNAVSDPNIALVVLFLGVLGLYVEFSTPGLIFPGVAGAILLLLGLTAMAVLPLNWLGVALIVLALALFVLEAKFTSFGILGAGGAVAMILGALLLVEGPPEFRIRAGTAIAIALPFAVISVFLTTLVIRAHGNKVQTGVSGLVGETGIARTSLDPEGKILVHGEYWDAVSSVAVSPGTRVRVLSVDGMRLRVEPLSNT